MTANQHSFDRQQTLGGDAVSASGRRPLAALRLWLRSIGLGAYLLALGLAVSGQAQAQAQFEFTVERASTPAMDMTSGTVPVVTVPDDGTEAKVDFVLASTPLMSRLMIDKVTLDAEIEHDVGIGQLRAWLVHPNGHSAALFSDLFTMEASTTTTTLGTGTTTRTIMVRVDCYDSIDVTFDDAAEAPIKKCSGGSAESLDGAFKPKSPFGTFIHQRVNDGDKYTWQLVLVDALAEDRSAGKHDVGRVKSATLRIAASEVVEYDLSIVAESKRVAEGENAVFTLTAMPAPAMPLTLTVTFSQEGTEFLADASARQVILSADAPRMALTIATDENADHEADGKVTAAFIRPASYASGSTTAVVTVIDDDAPRVELSAPKSIGEGEKAIFTITAVSGTAASSRPDLVVDLTGSETRAVHVTDDFVFPTAITLATGQDSAAFTVTTKKDDKETEMNSKLVVTLVASMRYNIVGKTSVTVDILDDDPAELKLPALSISAPKSIDEGGEAVFTITAAYPKPAMAMTAAMAMSEQPRPALTVQLTVAEDPMLYHVRPEYTFPTVITIAADATEVEFAVPTKDDKTDEMNSKLMATLRADAERYTIVGKPNAVVEIKDNDLPRLEITTSKKSIDERENATFVVTAFYTGTDAPRKDLTVALTVAEAPQLHVTALPISIIIPADPGSATFMVPTRDDKETEADSQLTASLGESEDYTLDDETSSAAVTIRDNDLIRLDFMASEQIKEGEDAVFTIRVTEATGSTVVRPALTVTLAVEETPQMYVEEDAPTSITVTIAADANTAMFTVSTTAVTAAAMNGMDSVLTASFADAADMRPFHIGPPARVVIRDDDGQAVRLQLAAVEESIEEGEDAVFVITVPYRDPVDSAQDVIVQLVVSETPGLHVKAEQLGMRSITIGAAAESVTFTVATKPDDFERQPHSKLSVSFGGNATTRTYDIVGENSVTIDIRDNDGLPGLAIEAPSSIEAGKMAVFVLTVTHEGEYAPKLDLTVGLKVEETATATEQAQASGDHVTAAEEANFPTSIVIAADAGSATFTVMTMDDQVDESDSELKVSFTDAAATRLYVPEVDSITVLIQDNDGLSNAAIQALNEAILSHVALAVASQVTGALNDRIRSVFDDAAAGPAAMGMRIQGASPRQFLERLAKPNASLLEWESANPSTFASPSFAQVQALRAWQRASASWSDLAFSQAFDGGGAGDGYGGLGVWGRAYFTDISVDSHAASFEGDISGFLAGVDAKWRNGVFGLAINSASADMDWSAGPAELKGTHETSLTGFHPYFGWRWDHIHVWASFGLESGDLTLTETAVPGDVQERDLEHQVYAAGVYRNDPECEIDPAANSFCIGFLAEAAHSRLTDDGGPERSYISFEAIQSGWVRAGLDFRGRVVMSGGSSLGLRAEAVVRKDTGDIRRVQADTRAGYGLDLGGGLDFTLPAAGLRFDLLLRGRMMAYTEAIEEFGFSGGITWDQGSANRGFTLSFRPEWGTMGGQRQGFWESGFASPSAIPMQAAMLAGGERRRQERGLTYALDADVRLSRHFSASYKAGLRNSAPLEHQAYIRYQRRF